MNNYLTARLLGARQQSDATFLILEDDSKISFKVFCARANQVANALAALDITAGDRVAVQAPKSWQALALYIGTIKAGGVFVPLNPAYTTHEMQYLVANAAPMVLICDPAKAQPLQAVANQAGATLLTLDGDGDGSFIDAVNQADTRFDAVARSADDLAAILYTSGTTGYAKGAMLSHHNLCSNAAVLTAFWRFSATDTLLHALPVFHTHGLFVATNVCMLAGASMIFQRNFDCQQVVRKLPAATAMMGVPTFYTRLLNAPTFNRDLVRHIRLFVSGSAPLSAATHIEFAQRTGHRIVERYGMTETNINTSTPYDGDRRAGTVGLALPTIDLRVAGDDGACVATGGIGSVQVKGDNIFAGYWKMPEKTAAEFTDDGFFITGDLGVLSADGYLTIVGRSKDLIISGGYNIYPKEIELILDQIAGVDESAVIGVPHADFGEAVVAVVTFISGVTAPTEDAIKASIGDQLAGFKQPKKIFHIARLPRNAMGKVQKNRLRNQFNHCFD